MVKRIILLLGIIWAVLCITSCIQVDTTICVKPDGSGRIEKRFLMSREFLDQIRDTIERMVDQMGVTAMPDELEQGFEVLDEESLKEEAHFIGDGVTYVSATKLINDWGEGYHVVYSFTDINTVRINQNPAESLPDISDDEVQVPDEVEYIGFEFSPGDPAKLMVKVIDKESSLKSSSVEKRESDQPGEAELTYEDEVPDEPDDSDDSEAEMKVEQIKKMAQGMKLRIAVEVAGSIVETNATYRDNSTVTLLEIDLSDLIKDPEKLEALSVLEPENFEEIKEKINGAPGIKIESKKQVTITFR